MRRKPWAVTAAALTATAGLVVAAAVYQSASAAEPAADPVAALNISVIDTASKQPVEGLETLSQGAAIDLAGPAGANITLQADPAEGTTVASIVFTLTRPGGATYTHKQNLAPYHLCNDYQACTPVTEVGAYSVSVQAFSKADGAGDKVGGPVVRSFRVMQSQDESQDDEGTLKVLFVGNSLLGTPTSATGQDTIAVTKKLAAAEGRSLDTTQVIHFGNTLQETWDAGEVAPALSDGETYDRIVLQEQSTLAAKSFAKAEATLLNTYAPALKSHLAPGGKILLFKNWALADNAGFSSRAANVKVINENYAKLSAELPLTNEIIPVSDAFEEVIDGGSPSQLIVADGRHPNDKAIYLDSALVYGQLFHESPQNLDDLYLDPDEASDLRQVAAEVLGF